MPQPSRKQRLRQFNQLKKEIGGLESQIIELEISLHQYNKLLAYHDQFNETGFRRIKKEKLRGAIDQLNQQKFYLMEQLMAQREALESQRAGRTELV